MKLNELLNEVEDALTIGDFVKLADPKRHEPKNIGEIKEIRDNMYVVMWDIHNSDLYDGRRLIKTTKPSSFSLGDKVSKRGLQGVVFSYSDEKDVQVLWNNRTYSAEKDNDLEEIGQ